MDDLNPCARCSGEGEILINVTDDYGYNDEDDMVICTRCKARTRIGYKVDMVSRWNRGLLEK